MLNVKLNPAFVVPNAAEFEKSFRACVTLESGVEELKEGLWANIVARIAKEGITADPQEMLNRLSEFEAIAQVVGGPEGPVERKRAPRKGVADTGYTTPDTFKTYKSIIKRAVVADVELLDEVGVPRPVNQVLNDLDSAKPEKTGIEKLTQATATWLAIFDKCDFPADAAAVAELVKQIVDKHATVS